MAYLLPICNPRSQAKTTPFFGLRVTSRRLAHPCFGLWANRQTPGGANSSPAALHLRRLADIRPSTRSIQSLTASAASSTPSSTPSTIVSWRSRQTSRCQTQRPSPIRSLSFPFTRVITSGRSLMFERVSAIRKSLAETSGHCSPTAAHYSRRSHVSRMRSNHRCSRCWQHRRQRRPCGNRLRLVPAKEVRLCCIGSCRRVPHPSFAWVGAGLRSRTDFVISTLGLPTPGRAFLLSRRIQKIPTRVLYQGTALAVPKQPHQ